MRIALLAAMASLLFAAAAPSQQLLSYDPLAGQITELQPWSALLPWPGGPTNVYPPVPMPALGPGIIPAPGDDTFDGTTGLHWLCNGRQLASQPTPLFPPTAAPVGPFPIAPAILAALGGTVTGIAIDPAAGILWLCGPAPVVIGVAPVPGTPVVVPAFPLAFAVGPLSGLDWDGTTGRLFAVDITGTVWPFLPGGAAAGAPIGVALPGPATGVALDKSGQPNAAGLRPIYVADATTIFDANLLISPPMIPGPPNQVGIAYLPAPAANPPGVGIACPCPSLPAGPVLFTNGPMTAGNATWRIGVGGLPPGQAVLFAFDFNFNPAWPLLNTVGCPMGFVLGSPTLGAAFGFANASGNASYPIPLVVGPGFGPIYNQNFTTCAADPAGFVVTPMQSIWASGL